MQVVNTNVFSLNSQRALTTSQNSMQTSLQRLSSGLRINSAKDDAAGLAISERFTAQIRGLDQANRNANDGISLLQTGEGALSEVSNSLQRMRELAVQAANATVGDADKASLNQEFQALASEISRNSASTKFNGVQVIGASATLNFQIGYEGGADSKIAVDTKRLANETGVASVLGGGTYTSYTFSGTTATASATATVAAGATYTSYTLSGGVKAASGTNSGAAAGTISTLAGASAMMSALDTALDSVSSLRADFGAAQNRLESAVRNNSIVIENQSAARSRVLDADFAKETANLSRTQILQQAGVAMLAQANQLPQSALSLL